MLFTLLRYIATSLKRTTFDFSLLYHIWYSTIALSMIFGVETNDHYRPEVEQQKFEWSGLGVGDKINIGELYVTYPYTYFQIYMQKTNYLLSLAILILRFL